MTQVIDPKLYTNEELIKAYHQQKEACRELNKTILSNSLQTTLPSECDNKIAVVRKLNMVESPDASIENLIDTKNTSTESLEEKAMSEKSEKEIKKQEEEEAAEVQVEEVKQMPQTDHETDALKMVQKTEIVLRVHPIMQETACQTDEAPADSYESLSSVNGELEKLKINSFVTPARKKHPEEVDCENLTKDLASQLSPSDKLHSILGR
jgi:hypothetical protein